LDDMKIRAYKTGDLEGISKIIDSLPEWLDTNARKNIPIDLEYQKCIVSEKDGSITGFLSYFVYEAVGIIAWIAVEKDDRNNGIGCMLLKEFETEMETKGIKWCQVYTLSDSIEYEPYNHTRAFYFKNGYKEYRRIPTDNPSCPEELYLRKRLDS